MMELETIKVIADTATTLTGEAKQVFIWWLLGKEVFGTLVSATVGLSLIYAGYRVLSGYICKCDCVSYIKRKRDEYNIGCPGVLTDTEYTLTINHIEKLINKGKNSGA